MKAIIVLFLAVFFSAMCANASWYWPFGDDEEKPPRLSELMEKASNRYQRLLNSLDNPTEFAKELGNKSFLNGLELDSDYNKNI